MEHIDVKRLYQSLKTSKASTPFRPARVTLQRPLDTLAPPPVLYPSLTPAQAAILASIRETLADMN